MSTDPSTAQGPRTAGLHLHRWTDRAVVGVAICAFASGFAQFGVVAALGDVARGFGNVTHGPTFADQAGLSGTELGIGLAIIRLASLGGLPITGLADRFGRRTMLLFTVGAGLVLTAVAAASPSYWWFVAIFACGRPLLSATNGLAQVSVGEQTASADRAKAVALVAAGYGAGAGAIAIVHSLASHTLGFRGVFALALVPLALLPMLRRWIQEPDRFAVAAAGSRHPIPVFGAVARPFRRRLAVVVVLAFAISVITGPANSFVFLFAQNFLHQPGVVTASMVVGAGVTGLAGLLAGRWLADRVGRRVTGAVAVAAVALLAVLTYSGSAPALVVGYILGVFCASVFAPALGALTTELFPTQVRASVVGWSLAAGVLGAVVGLIIFGSVSRAGYPFVAAGLLTFVPAVPVMGLFWLLPETRGREPEDLWPDLPRLPVSPHGSAPAPVYRVRSERERQHRRPERERSMSIEQNKAVVGKWFTAEGDYVVGQWEGGGTHTGAPFDDMPIGSLAANTGKVMRFTGTTVLKVENGLITEEIGLDDGLTALRQLGLIRQA